jgi:soluble lytic murein transglycosylase
MGWEAFDRAGGAWTRSLLEAVYPLPHREALVEAAAREGLPPALVAAVIRQESAFDARATSPAGAVGLMQLMPGTAAELARDPRPRLVDEGALTDPELSLELGARYLAAMLDRFDGSWTAALIAYNAGPRRYERWRGFPEFGGDRELAVERIPFGETRRYVKAVLRNVRVYRRLHGLPDGDVRAAE